VPTPADDIPAEPGTDDLLWPGDHRAARHLSAVALLDAMVRVEVAWLDALVATGVAPREASRQVADLVEGAGRPGVAEVAAGAEAGGNPVIPLVAAMRGRLGEPAATWLHRGLTSQDVLDTALVSLARDALADISSDLRRLAGACARLAEQHRDTVMAGRTLTQHAAPTTFGLVVAQWLTATLDALEDVDALVFPAQLGGAVGTRASLVELAGPERARDVVARTAADLGLAASPPWHSVRTTVTRLGDATVRASDACGHVAADVLVLGRTEVAEVREGSPGGSSTMPGKANPVLAALVRRAALTTPGLSAQLHLAAADSHDQRTAGAWHTEGAVLRDLLRRVLVAVDQTAELVEGLEVDAARMQSRAAEADDVLRAEQRSMAGVAGRDPAGTYLGEADALVDLALARARTHLEEER
jgi:3-carboxy-cis,cis-muconate cycloisomerase